MEKINGNNNNLSESRKEDLKPLIDIKPDDLKPLIVSLPKTNVVTSSKTVRLDSILISWSVKMGILFIHFTR